MSSQYSELEYLKKRAHTLRVGLYQRLEEICVSDFPTNTPQVVIDLLQNILTKVSHEIEICNDPKKIILICQLIQYYGQLLVFLDHAHTEQTPRGLVQILEIIIHNLNPNARLLVWPQAEYNYSIMDLLPYLKNTTETLFPSKDHIELFNNFIGPLNLISFPRIERDDILVHAIFGHEIGHPIADEFLDNEEKTSSYIKCFKDITDILFEEFKREIEDLPDIRKISYKRKLITELISIRKRGLQELTSDCIALLIFGPSALFAAYDIFITGALDDPPSPSEYYPPSRYRLRIIKNLMDQEGYTDSISQLIEENLPENIRNSLSSFFANIDLLISADNDIALINKEKILKVAYKWIEDSLNDAINFAKPKIESIIYLREKISSEIPELLSRIDLRLPPNEKGVYPNLEVVDWRSSILASWIYKISGHKNIFLQPIPLDVEDIENIQKITLRAIEYIVLQEKYLGYQQNS